MNAEPPQIIIRTAEEAASSPMVRAFETLHGNGEMTLGLERTPREEESETGGLAKTWQFYDLEAACMWLRMRARELSSEGIEIYIAGAWNIEHASAEPRIDNPLEGFRSAAVEEMLEW